MNTTKLLILVFCFIVLLLRNRAKAKEKVIIKFATFFVVMLLIDSKSLSRYKRIFLIRDKVFVSMKSVEN